MGTRVRTVASVVVLAAFGVALSACSRSPTAPTTSSIAITGTVPAVGQTSQLTAKATLSNGATQDVTIQATWSSSNTAVASVASGGLLKVLTPGSATITATYQNASGTLSVSVAPTTFSLSGRVTEFGTSHGISAATVFIGDGPNAGKSTTTNASGTYSFTELQQSSFTVNVSATNYISESRVVTLTSNQTLHANEDFDLRPLVTPADVSGSWAVTLSASPSCRGTLPEPARERAFTAVITQQGTTFHISLSSPTSYAAVPFCSITPGQPTEASGRILGAALSFVILGEEAALDGSFVVPCMVDSLTPTESLGIYGTVSGTVSGSEIHGSLDGHVDYYSPAQPVGGKPQTQCSAPDHAMVFRRR
jgi:hypothetical protein